MKKFLLLTILSIFMGITTVNAQEQESSKFTKTDEILAKSMEKAINLAEKTGEFVIDQAPDILKEFYLWNIFSNIFWIVILILFIIIFRYLPYLWLSKEKSDYNDTKYFNRWGYIDDVLPGFIAFGVVTLLSTLFIIINLYNLLFILIAPKLYLIDYFIK